MGVKIRDIFTLSNVDTGGRTYTVGEPSITNVDQQILVTGNVYASRSDNNGTTWTSLDPASFFPPAQGIFCCDQTLHHDPRRGLTFWLLQYRKTPTGNTLRLAVKRGATLHEPAWHWWDLVPEQVNPDWRGEWFDYNHAALSDNFLYVVTNAFTFDEHPTRCVVFRFSLANLADQAQLDVEYFQTLPQDNFSLRCTQGATDTMYFAGHNSSSQIRLFSWAEADNTATFTDIDVTRWIGDNNGYSAPGPDGKNWLGRCDPRITGGWVSNGIIGFMWSVDSTPSRQFPHVRVVRINQEDKHLIDEPDIWSPSFAYAYPDACPNIDGDVAITLFRGGGTLFPSHVVGVWEPTTTSWSLQGIQNGTHGPSDETWGDYLTCRRHTSTEQNWLAIGFTLQGGGGRTNIQPCIAHFERV